MREQQYQGSTIHRTLYDRCTRFPADLGYPIFQPLFKALDHFSRHTDIFEPEIRSESFEKTHLVEY